MKLVLTAERQRRCVICDLHDNGPGASWGTGITCWKGTGVHGMLRGRGVLAVPITTVLELLPCSWWGVLWVLGSRGKVKRVHGPCPWGCL